MNSDKCLEALLCRVIYNVVHLDLARLHVRTSKLVVLIKLGLIGFVILCRYNVGVTKKFHPRCIPTAKAIDFVLTKEYPQA